MKKVKIYEGILVLLDRNETNNINYQGDQSVCKMLSFTNIKTINCVIDEARGNAIDLETGCVYHIIERDGCGIISQEEAKFIKNSEKYTLFLYRFHEKNMEDISLLYQIFLNSRAQDKYKEYLQNFGNKEVEKVKKFGKKGRN